jgi:hypothetical protein
MDKKDIKISFSPQIPVKLLIKDVPKIYVDKVVRAIKGDKGDKGDAGIGLSSGGITGQFLSKKSNADYDTEWEYIDIPEQTQSDLAQEDDTALDFVKNKHADYIQATLYEEGEEGEQIPAYEGTVEEVLNLYLYIINDAVESLGNSIDRKQDPIEDITIWISHSQWNNKEVIIYTSDVTPESKLWYSPTNESYNDFVDAEIRMIEQDYGRVKFRCETTPEEDINIIIRRA